MLTQSTQCSRLVLVRLNSGDDVLQAIRTAVQQENIQQGVILSGVGSINRYHVHVVNTLELPSDDVFIQGEGPFDILSLTGLIIEGRVHAHITFSNTEIAMGGHLEEGCRVLTFSVVVLAETPESDLSNWDQPGHLIRSTR